MKEKLRKMVIGRDILKTEGMDFIAKGEIRIKEFLGHIILMERTGNTRMPHVDGEIVDGIIYDKACVEFVKQFYEEGDTLFFFRNSDYGDDKEPILTYYSFDVRKRSRSETAHYYISDAMQEELFKNALRQIEDGWEDKQAVLTLKEIAEHPELCMHRFAEIKQKALAFGQDSPEYRAQNFHEAMMLLVMRQLISEPAHLAIAVRIWQELIGYGFLTANIDNDLDGE
ncbi:MAG: hypothetical protein Q4C04_04265 [Clostridia bacterium]|nr:hypothetical protein [Clostridia bacterium]